MKFEWNSKQLSKMFIVAFSTVALLMLTVVVVFGTFDSRDAKNAAKLKADLAVANEQIAELNGELDGLVDNQPDYTEAFDALQAKINALEEEIEKLNAIDFKLVIEDGANFLDNGLYIGYAIDGTTLGKVAEFIVTGFDKYYNATFTAVSTDKIKNHSSETKYGCFAPYIAEIDEYWNVQYTGKVVDTIVVKIFVRLNNGQTSSITEMVSISSAVE